jgi:hypothetical protein
MFRMPLPRLLSAQSVRRGSEMPNVPGLYKHFKEAPDVSSKSTDAQRVLSSFSAEIDFIKKNVALQIHVVQMRAQ